MANPWLTHLSAFHKSHPGNSYKENMKLARGSYTPISKEKKSSKEKKPQKGKGLYGAEAEAAAEGLKTLGNVSNSAINAVQTDKSKNGRYVKAQFDKKTREIGRLQRLMKRGKFPKLSLEDTLKYVEEHYQ